MFGDLRDPKSRVVQLQKLARTYGLLEDQLNVKPRTRYVAKVRNPAPGLDGDTQSDSSEPMDHRKV